MENDYPAAHSMDTQWFAVDRDGHVGYFTTGEAGAMPEGAMPEEAFAEGADPLNRLHRFHPQGEGLYDLAGFLTPCQNRAQPSHLPFAPDSNERTRLMFLASLDPVKSEVDAGRAEVVPSQSGVTVILQGTPTEVLEQLHRENHCLSCFFHWDRDPDVFGPDPAEWGMFVYEHLTENWISGPYGRQRCPSQPLHIDQLPPDLRNELKQFTLFSLSFKDTPHIQPVEHAPCVSWETAWLDVTGTHIRAMPGREEEYRDASEEYSAEWIQDYGYQVHPVDEEEEDSADPFPDDESPNILRFPGVDEETDPEDDHP